MPGMPRPSKKAQKIADAIIGTPANMRPKRSKKKKKINESLIFQETTRVR